MGAKSPAENKSLTVLRIMQRREHPDCIFCNGVDGLGIELDWRTGVDRDVRLEFRCDGRFQSYRGIVHGGVISLLFDGAMTNCLFAEGRTAVTGELTVRYHASVPVDRTLLLTARVVRSRPPLHLLEAELSCQGEILARATGKFMEKDPALTPTDEAAPNRYKKL